MAKKQPTILQPNRSSARMTKLSGKGNSRAHGKAASKKYFAPNYPMVRDTDGDKS